jgi:hypothetical protein
MSLTSDTWLPNNSHPGPPPGANNARFEGIGFYQCDTLGDLRLLETKQDNERFFAVLKGRDAKFDGLLQGVYCYVPPGYQNSQSDSDSWVIANDGRSAWQKLI